MVRLKAARDGQLNIRPQLLIKLQSDFFNDNPYSLLKVASLSVRTSGRNSMQLLRRLCDTENIGRYEPLFVGKR